MRFYKQRYRMASLKEILADNKLAVFVVRFRSSELTLSLNPAKLGRSEAWVVGSDLRQILVSLPGPEGEEDVPKWDDSGFNVTIPDSDGEFYDSVVAFKSDDFVVEIGDSRLPTIDESTGIPFSELAEKMEWEIGSNPSGIELSEEMKEKDQEIIRLEEELAKMKAELSNLAPSAELATVKSSLSALNAELIAAKAEIEDYKQSKLRLEARVNELNKDLTEARQCKQDQLVEITQLKSDLANAGKKPRATSPTLLLHQLGKQLASQKEISDIAEDVEKAVRQLKLPRTLGAKLVEAALMDMNVYKNMCSVLPNLWMLHS